MSPSDLILALDIGTSSLRAALFDSTGTRLPKTTAQVAYQLRVDQEGAAELAVHDLERAAVRAIRTTLDARHRHRALKDRPIAAVATSCFWHSLLGYDARRGQPTPIYTWGDSRCRDDARQLRAEMDEKSYHRRTGCLLRAPYWPAKLRWLARTGAAHGVTAWMSPAEWLYRRLAGQATVSLSMASGTGLLNLRTGQWDTALLRRLKISEKTLSPISDPPQQGIPKTGRKPLLHKFSELKDALWYPAIGDGAAGNLGSDAVLPGHAALNVGTSAAVRLVTTRIPAHPEPGLFCHRLDERRLLLGGAISNAGNLRAWALQQLRLPDDPAVLERALAQRTLPAPSLTVLPFWTAERSPSWPDTIGGTITGLTPATSALDLLQALVEAPYHRLAQIADLLAPHSRTPLELIVSGGIRHSAQSLQRLANVLGRPLRPCREPEASLRGAALHALEDLQMEIKPLPRSPVISPEPAPARAYTAARAAQIALEQTMRVPAQKRRASS